MLKHLTNSNSILSAKQAAIDGVAVLGVASADQVSTAVSSVIDAGTSNTSLVLQIVIVVGRIVLQLVENRRQRKKMKENEK